MILSLFFCLVHGTLLHLLLHYYNVILLFWTTGLPKKKHGQSGIHETMERVHKRLRRTDRGILAWYLVHHIIINTITWHHFYSRFIQAIFHWPGLEKIHELTSTPTQYEVRFDIGFGSERVYAVYDNFKLAPVKQKFKLTIGNYKGNAGECDLICRFSVLR